jgi:hypothetical protein
MKGVLSWLVRWASRTSTRDFCSALAVQASPVHFQFLSPSPSKLGRHPCWVACLLVCVSDYYLLYTAQVHVPNIFVFYELHRHI